MKLSNEEIREFRNDLAFRCTQVEDDCYAESIKIQQAWQDIADNVLNGIEYENTSNEGVFIVDGIENHIIQKYEHPNCGVYAVEIEDAQNRHWIVPPEDIEEEPEVTVDNIPVDVLQVYQQDGSGIIGYLVRFPDGRKSLTDHVDIKPMMEEDFEYEKFDWDSIPI